MRRERTEFSLKIITGDASEGFHSESSLGSEKHEDGWYILHFASELKRGMENANGRTRLL